MEAEDSTSLRITWAPPPEDKQHGDIMYYKIYFVENHEPDALTKEITISNANTREYVINELRKWTEYKVSMLAGTSVGDGPLTEFKLIRTDEDGTFTHIHSFSNILNIFAKNIPNSLIPLLTTGT